MSLSHIFLKKKLLITWRRINYNTLVYFARHARAATGYTAGHPSVGHHSILHLFAIPSSLDARQNTNAARHTWRSSWRPEFAVMFHLSNNRNPHNRKTSHTKAADYPSADTYRIFFIIRPTAAAESNQPKLPVTAAVIGTATKETHVEGQDLLYSTPAQPFMWCSRLLRQDLVCLRATWSSATAYGFV